LLPNVLYFKKQVGCLLLLICLGFFSVLYSQRTNLQFQRFTIEQGLAQNSVLCILQDQKGFMWFGTEQGMNRFDGYTFAVHKFQYNNPNSLSNSFVFSFHEDSSGIFWIGTNGGGLNRFDPENKQFSHYLVDPESIDSLSNILNVVFEDHSQGLWIGTGGGGLKKFDRKSKTFTDFPVNSHDPNLLTHNTINAIWEDHGGTLWIGTDGGLKKLNRMTNQIDPMGLDDKKVLALYEDNARQFWVGTDNGFYKFVPSNKHWVHFQVPASEKNFYSANQIRTFYEDRLGIFWIGTEYGLYIFDRQGKTYHTFYADLSDPRGLTGNRIGAIYEDRSGALWIGVEAGGLHKLNRTEQSFNYYYRDPKNPDSLIMRDVFAIYEDQEGVLWVGTYGEGLIAFIRKTGEFINYRNQPEDPNSLSDNRIWALCEDRQGRLWIGTAGRGLNQFTHKTGKFTRYQHQPQNPNSLSSDLISCIIEDKEENLWIATNGGLDKLDPQRKQFTRYQSKPNHPNTLGHNNVYVLIEDRKGILWIGTKGGLSRFDPKSDTFTTYRIYPQYSNNMIQPVIYSLWEDRQGVLWLGTTSGLHKFHRENGTFSLYTEKDGLPNDVINGILEDEQGNLWLSTNEGVSKFNPFTGKFKNYSVEDGLQSYEFNAGSYFKSRSGELFFGGINGFNAFFPDSIKDNPYIPPVVITDFKIFNQSVPIGKEFKGRITLERSITDMDAITLSHKHHTFSFEYAALNYIHSEKNEYAYMMKGIEDSWNYVGQRRFVTYANLAPGDYTFKVKASNNHGVWNEEGVSLKITILPHFWETWWFRMSLAILILALVFIVFRVRTRLILKRNRELEETVARRTTALRESEEKYRTVVERAHSGIAIIQDEGIAFNNTQFANLLGYGKTDITHQPLVQFVAAEKQSEFNDLLADSRNEKRLSGNFETILRHKEDQPIHVEISYGSIRYKKQPALLMFFHDIRMQKLLEEERMKTAKLESTRILAGGIAHDFNNLLTIILGNIELAIGDVNPGEGNQIWRALSDAEISGRKAADLVRQFITLSKGDAPIKKTEYMQPIIRDAVHSVLQGSNVSIHFDLPDDLWAVDCDTQQIKQSIENIVINAKQAMTADGVLEITAQNKELTPQQIPNKKAGKYVCITLKDNGVGIASEDLPRIFDPYFSTRDDVTQKGLGLGLSVVQSIISKHEGTIHVASEVNVGTTVRICLTASS